MQRIYLDHNATTPLRPEALEAMLPLLREQFGNPSSIHAFGKPARQAIETARGRVAAHLGCEEHDIVFTSGGTESDNWALDGVIEANAQRGKHIIISKIEHHAVLNTAKHLARRKLSDVSYADVDCYGRVDPQQVASLIRDDTVLVSVMAANNEVGTLQPLAEIGRICRERGVIFHTDAVQAGGKLRLNVDALNVDLLTLSGHKFYGPKGTGVLYIRPRTKIAPLIRGGHHESGRRAGTENAAGIVGLGTALELAGAELETENARLVELRDRLERGLSERLDYLVFNGHPAQRLSNTSNVTFSFIEGEALLLHLDALGIAASSGSACTSATLGTSHVLDAMGLPPELGNGALRFSLGRDNTAAQIDYTVDSVARMVKRLREMSPLWDKLQKGTYDPTEFAKLKCYFDPAPPQPKAD